MRRIVAFIFVVFMLGTLSACSVLSDHSDGAAETGDSANTSGLPDMQEDDTENEYEFWHDSDTNKNYMDNRSYDFSLRNWATQGDTLYCFVKSEISGKDPKIIRIDTTGKNDAQTFFLVNDKNGSSMNELDSIIPVGDNLFFIFNGLLYKLYMPDGTVTCVNSGLSEIKIVFLWNDNLYFLADDTEGEGSWYRYDCKEKFEAMDIPGALYTKSFFVYDGYLYYTGDGGIGTYIRSDHCNLYRFKLEGGTERETVFELKDIYNLSLSNAPEIYNIFVHDSQIYIRVYAGNNEDATSLLRCNMDGTGMTRLVIGYPHIGDGYVDGYYVGDALFDFQKITSDTTEFSWDDIKSELPYPSEAEATTCESWFNGEYFYHLAREYDTENKEMALYVYRTNNDGMDLVCIYNESESN